MTKTIFTQPLVQITENFLTHEECHSLIDIAEKNLVRSTVVGGDDGVSIISSKRTSHNYDLPKDHELTEVIHSKISNHLNIDSSRFERIEIIRYKPNELFETHVDYFGSHTAKSNLKQGGQRVGTVILYLNDVLSEGETFFPRLRHVEQPKTGKMLYFKYDYDFSTNMKTKHKGMPINFGEKWIATVWIRESSRTQIYEDYEMDPLPIVTNIEYDLECLTSIDSRTLNLVLPGNHISENTIMIEIVPDKKSILLLYLVSVLNLHQVIPYFILPIISGDYTSDEIDNMITDINMVKKLSLDEFILIEKIYNRQESALNIFIDKSKDTFYKFSYLFVSNTEEDQNDYEFDESKFLMRPFLNLQQDHIIFAIKELNLFKI